MLQETRPGADCKEKRVEQEASYVSYCVECDVCGLCGALFLNKRARSRFDISSAELLGGCFFV